MNWWLLAAILGINTLIACVVVTGHMIYENIMADMEHGSDTRKKASNE